MKLRAQKPTEQPPAKAKPFAYRGLWRDGRWLVVDLQEHAFPNRCVKTNQPVEPPQPPLRLTCFSPPYLEVERLRSEHRQDGDAKVTIIEGHKQTTRVVVELKVPLNPRWQRILHTPLGTRLLWGGAALILLRLASQWLTEQLELSGEFLGLWMWVLIIPALAIGAFVLLFQSFILNIRRLDECKIWISGVHRDWLKPLPEFVPSQGMIERQMFAANGQLWVSIGLAIALFVLVICAANADLQRDALQALSAVLLLIAGACIVVGNRARTRIAHLRRQKAELYPVKTRRRRR